MSGKAETRPEEFPLIIDWWYNLAPNHPLIFTIIPGLSPFAIGLAISYTIGFENVYLRSLHIYLGSFGISWVLACLRWGSLNFHHALAVLRPSILMDEATYHRFIYRELSQLANNRNIACLYFSLIAFAWLSAAVSFFWPDPSLFAYLPVLRTSPPEWFDGRFQLQKMLVIDVYALVVAVPLATGIWTFLASIPFTLRLSSLNFVPITGVLSASLYELTGLYLRASFTWFVGVALFAIWFLQALDPLSVTFILSLGGIGFAMFLFPQYSFHRAMVKARTQMVARVADIYHAWFSQPLNVSKTMEEFAIRVAMLTNLTQLSRKADTWVFSPRDIAILVGGQLLSIVAVVTKQSIS